MLIEGRWKDEDRTIIGGLYVRAASRFSDPLTEDLTAALTNQPGRFHLIASFSCPWSHRALLARVAKGLDDAVILHVAGGPRTEGYRVGSPEHPWPVPGTEHRIVHLHELYALVDADLTGRVTVPVLWDAHQCTIISNESANIVRAFDAAPPTRGQDWTLRPTDMVDAIAALNHWMQVSLSNAVYRAGKARDQDAYEEAVEEVFASLDVLEERLSKARLLHGSVLTESDLRLWPTLVRFDAVYHGHFKCSRHRLIDYQALWGYARDLYALPGFAATFDETAIRQAYYGEDRDLNPQGVVAVAPAIHWSAPHDRTRLGRIEIALRGGKRIALDQRLFCACAS